MTFVSLMFIVGLSFLAWLAYVIYGNLKKGDVPLKETLLLMTLGYIAWIGAFAVAYKHIYLADSKSFAFTDVADFKSSWVPVFYFSVTTITSTGYGDIHPVSSIAMLVAMFEMLLGVFFNVALFSVFAGFSFRWMRDR